MCYISYYSLSEINQLWRKIINLKDERMEAPSVFKVFTWKGREVANTRGILILPIPFRIARTHFLGRIILSSIISQNQNKKSSSKKEIMFICYFTFLALCQAKIQRGKNNHNQLVHMCSRTKRKFQKIDDFHQKGKRFLNSPMKRT